MSLVRRIINKKKNEKKDSYVAGKNFMIFGNNSKSSLAAALSDHRQGTVIEFTPAGASKQLEDEYSNFISYPVSSLAELNALIDSLHSDLNMSRQLGRALKLLEVDKKNRDALKIVDRVKKAVAKNGDDYAEVEEMAKKGELPIKAVVIAECNIISSWIEDDILKKFSLEVVGSDAKNMGMDWNKYKTEITKFYQKALNLPVTTILSTSEYLPSEKQTLTNVAPNFCMGSAARAMYDIIGNVFYSTYESGKYVVYLKTDQKKIFTKQKVQRIKSNSKELVEKIDITGKPEFLWQYLDDFRKNPVSKK